MKKIYIVLGILFSGHFLMAQSIDTRDNGIVGIGLTSGKPYTTLHIEGNPNDINAKDGLLVPRLSLEQLVNKNPKIYGNDQKSVIIYVYDTENAQELAKGIYQHIINDEFYYWDGYSWYPLNTKRIIYITGEHYEGNLQRTLLEFHNNNTTHSTGRDKSTKFLDEEPVFETEEEKEEMKGASYYNKNENILYVYDGKEWVKTLEFNPPKNPHP